MTDRIHTIPVTLRDGTETEGGWVDLFPPLGSQVHYRGEVIEIDQAFAARMLSNFTRFLTLYGKEPVMLRQHEREGWQYGVWAAMRISDNRIQGLAAFLDEQALARFKSGQLREWSPGFGDVEDPHTGELLRDMMVEASFVDRGHQWDLRPPSLTNPTTLAAGGELHTLRTLMDNNEQMDLEDNQTDAPDIELADAAPAFDLAEAFSAMNATLAALADGQNAIMAALAVDAAEDAAPEDGAAQMAALQAEICELRRTNTLQALAADGITGSTADALATLADTEPKQFAAAVEELRGKFATPTPRQQKELGASGSANVGGSLEPAQIVELAAKDGIEPGSGRIIAWVHSNHPGREGDVATFLNI